MPRAFIIFNPQAGEHKQRFTFVEKLLGIYSDHPDSSLTSSEKIQVIEERFLGHGWEVTVSLTEGPGHATELAKGACQSNLDVIVAVGGDGTINEVINGLVGQKTPLGVIPIGTANVFSLQFDIPKALKDACDRLINAVSFSIDLGCVNGRYFACMAGVGFDAYVIKEADKKWKKSLGVLSYIVVAFFEFFSYRFKPIEVCIDDDPKRYRASYLIIGNMKYYGGKLVANPQADCQDGYLDACLLEKNSLLKTLSYIFGMWRGTLSLELSARYFQFKELKINHKRQHSVHVDAEYLCETPVTIKVIPNWLQVRC